MATRFAPILKTATRSATKVVKNAAKNALKETGKDMMTSYLKGQFTPSPVFIRSPSPSFSGSPVSYTAFAAPSAFSRPIQYPVPCVCTVTNNAPKVGNKSVFVCNYCGSPAKTPANVAANLQEPTEPVTMTGVRNASNGFKALTGLNDEELTNESFMGGRRTRKLLRRHRHGQSRNRY